MLGQCGIRPPPLQARTDFMQKEVLSIAPLSAYADEVARLSSSPAHKKYQDLKSQSKYLENSVFNKKCKIRLFAEELTIIGTESLKLSSQDVIIFSHIQ